MALAAPAAAAGLAYVNAKTSFFYDYNLVVPSLTAQIKIALRERKDRLSVFYILEENAQGKLANKPFMIFEGRQWTYKEVYQTALKYGTWLKKKYRVMPKDVVAMDFMNSDKFIFIWFGLWSIGAKPAFINYNLTGKALSHCVRVSTARVVLVDPQVLHNVTEDVKNEVSNVQFEIFGPELEAEVMTTEGVREPDSTRSEDKGSNIAILIYTSGTTGLPKPAIVSWQKVISSGVFIPGWNKFKQDDIMYTVGQLGYTSKNFL